MHKIYRLLLLALLMPLLSILACSDDQEAGGQERMEVVSEGEEPRAEIRLTPRRGLYTGTCQLKYSQSEEPPAEYNVGLYYSILFQEDKAELKVNRLTLNATITRTSGRKMTYTLDTDKPEEVSEDIRGLADFTQAVVGSRILYELTSEGAVKRMTFAPPQAIGAEDADNFSPVATQAPQDLWPALTMLLGPGLLSPSGLEVAERLTLTGLKRMIPEDPLGAGARWKLLVQMHFPSSIGLRTTLFQAQMETLEAGDSASIAFSASEKVPSKSPPPQRVRDGQYTLRGTWDLNLRTGQFVREHSVLEGQAQIEKSIEQTSKRFEQKVRRELKIELLPADDPEPSDPQPDLPEQTDAD